MKQQPVIAIVTPGSFPIPSGKSSSVETVVERLSEKMADRIQMFVFGKRAKRQPVCEVLSNVTYVRPSLGKAASYIAAVGAKLKRLQPDLVQVENRPRYAAYLRRRLPGCAIWLSLHSDSFMSKPHIRKAEFRRCLQAVDKIIVNSRFLKRQVLERAPGVGHKIAVNHLGVDPDEFYSRWTPGALEESDALRKRYGLEGKKIILYAGRLIPKKGVHHLLRAMRRIRDEQPDALLVIVGSAFYGSRRLTPYVRRLRKTAGALGQQVRFIPFVPHKEMPRWFRLADVLCVPSRNEPFGLVNVEAMASGVPVVATRAGGIKEIVEHGRTGYLADRKRLSKELALYVVRLLGDPELRHTMGENGIAKVRDYFAWDRVAERQLALYGNGLMPYA